MFRNVSFNFATTISKFDTFSLYHIVRTRIAKVTNFFPFCTIGISMYQKLILPYFSIPSTFSPQASSPLERCRRTDGGTDFNTLSPLLLSFFHWARGALPAGATSTPFHPYFFLFSTERAGPYLQAQLYWAGRTMGWMADWTRRCDVVSLHRRYLLRYYRFQIDWFLPFSFYVDQVQKKQARDLSGRNQLIWKL